jgi:hypothetical protein
MRETVKYEDLVAPDGVAIAVNWDALEVGMSLFIPAINLLNLDRQVQKIAMRKNFSLKGFNRIENGRLGIRFWRVL